MTTRRKLGAIPTMLRLLLRAPRHVLALERLGAATDAAFPDQDASYIEAMGVRPDAQGRGHGRRLMDRIIKESERTQVGCYLATVTANVPFYEELGFCVLREVDGARHGTPTGVRMLRVPQSA
jgi:GNAT superfamily N-acetyltransferase